MIAVVGLRGGQPLFAHLLAQTYRRAVHRHTRGKRAARGGPHHFAGRGGLWRCGGETSRPSGWMRCCATLPDRASRSWASALACSFLFDKSHEYGEHAGLGLIPGEVRPLAPVLAPRRKGAAHGLEQPAPQPPGGPAARRRARGEISSTTCIRSTQPAAERRSPQAPITAASPSQAPSGAAACAARSFTRKRAVR